MPILSILILALLAAMIGLMRRGRTLALLGASALIVYWLEPPYIHLGVMYWLPTLTLVLSVTAWVLSAPPEARTLRRNLPAFLVLAAASLVVGLNRYLQIEEFFATVTPRPHLILAAWFSVLVGLLILGWLTRRLQRFFLAAAILGVIGLLVIIKSPWLTQELYQEIVSIPGIDPYLVPATLQWLGFSYISFRLLHTFFDRLSGRLPAVSLDEYVTFVIFFPALTAGPIDRIERFVRDLRQPKRIDRDDWLDAGKRFFTGLFKKFVLADALALVAIDVFAPYLQTAGWAWLVLYLFTFRIFFDFSGYTDIAIGIARLVGIRLPENFANPYLKPNLAQFWNSWHMSLTQWFRIYFFNPLVRALRSARRPFPAFITVAIAQFGTMLLIGLWHGITWNYILWGVWHAIGLFVQNRWSEWVRPRASAWAGTPLRRALLHTGGVLLTFHYVALGWIFFAFSTPEQSWFFFLKLIGQV